MIPALSLLPDLLAPKPAASPAGDPAAFGAVLAGIGGGVRQIAAPTGKAAPPVDLLASLAGSPIDLVAEPERSPHDLTIVPQVAPSPRSVAATPKPAAWSRFIQAETGAGPDASVVADEADPSPDLSPELAAGTVITELDAAAMPVPPPVTPPTAGAVLVAFRSDPDTGHGIARPIAPDAPAPAIVATPTPGGIADATQSKVPATVAAATPSDTPAFTGGTVPTLAPAAMGPTAAAPPNGPRASEYDPAAPAAPIPAATGAPAPAVRAVVSGSARQVFAADLRRAARDPRTVAAEAPAAPPEAVRLDAAAAAMPAAAPIDLRQERWPSAMVDRIERLRDAADAADTRIRLIPDALGVVDVAVKRDGDAVQVRFTAEQAATRALLQDAAPRLAEAAEARGLKLGQTSVGDGGSQPNGRQPQQPSAPAPARPRSAAASGEDATDIRIA